MNNISFKKFIPGIAWFFLVLILICTPGQDLPEVDTWLQQLFIDKIIHLMLFGILAYLFMYPFKKSTLNKKEKLQYFLRIAIAVSIWGITTEFIQKFYIPNRSFDLYDWIADSVGALIPSIIFRKKVQ
ncbi:VanZ family protein [Ferruginibacter sp. SUN002]|uniref:VanZ family protein n=1 Tax=Ferruginibacter sp. SUN002 TaxID=2937789 RepID=UPI003D35C266